jgi:ribosome-binding factor A
MDMFNSMQLKPSKPKRKIQVGGLIQKEISDLLLRKIKDPRLEMVTISGVDISPDLKQARVFFSRFGEPADIQRALEGLKSAAGFIKRELGQRLKLRHVPELEFMHDTSYAYGDRIESLIKGLLPPQDPDES